LPGGDASRGASVGSGGNVVHRRARAVWCPCVVRCRHEGQARSCCLCGAGPAGLTAFMGPGPRGPLSIGNRKSCRAGASTLRGYNTARRSRPMILAGGCSVSGNRIHGGSHTCRLRKTRAKRAGAPTLKSVSSLNTVGAAGVTGVPDRDGTVSLSVFRPVLAGHTGESNVRGPYLRVGEPPQGVPHGGLRPTHTPRGLTRSHLSREMTLSLSAIAGGDERSLVKAGHRPRRRQLFPPAIGPEGECGAAGLPPLAE
jgi:hypothetical protein